MLALWGAAARWRSRSALQGASRLHLGSGAKLLPGWANLDRTGPAGVIRIDLTGPLPIQEDSVDVIYSEHFIEHVSLTACQAVLGECFRVLRPGGRIRISTPDLEAISRLYLDGRVGDWADVNWMPTSPCRMLNELHREWGHTFIYDFAELSACLRQAGFIEIVRLLRNESETPALRDLETRPDHGDLIVEASKPLR
jgi:predicted SAM-dependent methyltransferase